MGNPFSSLLDVTKISNLSEGGRSVSFSYDDYYKNASKSERVIKEKKGYWGHEHDDDCD